MSARGSLTTGRDNKTDNMGKPNVPNTARKLNMDEKRKLEKVLLADIDAALAAYEASRRERREPLLEKATSKPSAKVAALAARFKVIEAEQQKIRSELHELGYSCSGHGGLSVGYGATPEPLRPFDAETAKVGKAFAALKRTYTLKLFAGGEEAQELFASLGRELAAIVTN